MNATPSKQRTGGFTLMETVIAIGVLSVLLTGFMIVFTPAADGIRRAISTQEADRLLTALSNELVNPRLPAEGATGFDKAFLWIKDSTGAVSTTDGGNADNALLLFQYRGDPNPTNVVNGAPRPVVSVAGLRAGQNYTLVPILRRRSAVSENELKAAEGPVYLVKCVQLVFQDNALGVTTSRGQIINPQVGANPAGPFNAAADYPDATLSFQAEFYPLPSKAHGYVSGSSFATFYQRAVRPSFVRNLAVRR